MQNIFTMVLAGGRGERLHPLTEHRAKPAVPFGGKYRIIDFTLSNCLNSGLRKVAVLIQYKSHSLDRHIRTGWDVYNAELGEFIASMPEGVESNAFARPKSRTLTFPSGVIFTFAGFRSR